MRVLPHRNRSKDTAFEIEKLNIEQEMRPSEATLQTRMPP